MPVYHTNVKALSQADGVGTRWAIKFRVTSGKPRLDLVHTFSSPWVSSPAYLGSELPKAEAPLLCLQSVLGSVPQGKMMAVEETPSQKQ